MNKGKISLIFTLHIIHIFAFILLKKKIIIICIAITFIYISNWSHFLKLSLYKSISCVSMKNMLCPLKICSVYKMSCLVYEISCLWDFLLYFRVDLRISVQSTSFIPYNLLRIIDYTYSLTTLLITKNEFKTVLKIELMVNRSNMQSRVFKFSIHFFI